MNHILSPSCVGAEGENMTFCYLKKQKTNKHAKQRINKPTKKLNFQIGSDILDSGRPSIEYDNRTGLD